MKVKSICDNECEKITDEKTKLLKYVEVANRYNMPLEFYSGYYRLPEQEKIYEGVDPDDCKIDKFVDVLIEYGIDFDSKL